MKKLYTLFCLGLLLSFISLISFAFVAEAEIKEHPFVIELKKQLGWYSEQAQAEKIYLQLDKTSYQPGELIWYKLYLRNANDLTAEGVSDIVYVELISPKGTIQEETTRLAVDGNATGHFQILSTLPGGRYTLKAYTNWMKNSGEVFEKEVLVQKPILPNLHRKLEFERKAYGAGDKVTADLSLESLEKTPIRYKAIDFTISLDGDLVEKQTSQTDFEGKAKIQFVLPDSLNSTDGILTVGLMYRGQRESITRSIPIVQKNIDLQFFPEGGDLVHELPSQLAFKAVNEFGKASDVEGQIFNAQDQLIADFKSYHNGMGKLDFVGKADQTYYAKITKPAGISERYPIPKVLEEGFSMSVVETKKEALTIKLYSSKKSLIHLVAQSGDKLYFSSSQIVDGRLDLEVETIKFPIGITRLTLFDDQKQARCERLVFLNKYKKLQVDIQFDKEAYAPREKVKLDIQIKDEKGNPVQGSFSVAVTDDKLLRFVDDKQANILSSLLLESELKGEIEAPNFYFDEKETKADLALDLVMMTHGWRRFDWQLIQNENQAIAQFPKELRIVRGIVLDENRKALANAKVRVKDTELEVMTDETGIFEFKEIDLAQQSAILEISADDYGTQKRNVLSYQDTIQVLLGGRKASIQGIVSSKEAQQTLANCKVTIINAEQKAWHLYTDKLGTFAFHQIPEGKYDVLLNMTNYQKRLIQKLDVNANKAIQLDIDLSRAGANDSEVFVSNYKQPEDTKQNNLDVATYDGDFTIIQEQNLSSKTQNIEELLAMDETRSSAMLLDEVVVVSYKVPLISQDNTSTGIVLSSEQIQRLPTRNINAMAAQTAGISNVDDGENLNIRGARTAGTVYYVDGMRVSGNLVPNSEVQRVEFITGGVDAAYGGGEASVIAPSFRAGKMAMSQKNDSPSYEQALGRSLEESYQEDIFVRGKKHFTTGYYPKVYRSTRPTMPKKLYSIVDQLPRFYDKECEKLKEETARQACAQEKMQDYIDRYLKRYNLRSVEKAKHGLFQFFVNKKGEIGGVKFFANHKKVGYFPQWQYQQAINRMPKWIPAKRASKRVACWYTIPVDLGDLVYRQKTMYAQTRQFYAPNYKNRTRPSRHKAKDYRSTIHWAPNVQTDEAGTASLSFWNSDAVSSFRVTLEGLSKEGQLAQAEESYFTRVPISLQVKAPFSALQGDRLQLPVSISNHTDQAIYGELSIQLPPSFEAAENWQSTHQLEANASKTVFVPLKMIGDKNAIRSSRHQHIEIRFKTKLEEEIHTTKIQGYELGYPVRQVFTDTKLENQFKLNIDKPIKGTVQAKLRAYPDRLAEITATLDKMLRQPYGCFEQTSSITYPNILAYNLLKQKGSTKSNAYKKALDYIKRGRDRLLGFEVKGGGFDWYGRGPAHEGLTAYGLQEFVDMKKVLELDEGLIERTVDWLLSRRDGKGGWKRRKRGSFGNAKPNLGDAYVVWSMCEAGFGHEIPKEINKSYRVALKTKDSYILALMANALYLLDDPRAEEVMQILLSQQKEKAYWEGKQGTISSNGPRNSRTETTALVALALMKKNKDVEQVLNQSINFLMKQKNAYGFGSTQSTILVLKALVQYSLDFEKENKGGVLKIYADGELIREKAYTSQVVSFDQLEKSLVNGTQDVTVVFEKTDRAIPFEIELKYQTLKELESKDCKLSLSTSLRKHKIQMGEMVRLDTKLQNTTTDTLESAIAMIGIPAGLSLQAWQLKEIQEKAHFDYYEMFDGKLVLHFINMMPSELKTISFDLKADIPGVYNAYASSAYLYYDNDAVFWTATEGVSIVP